MQYEKDTICAIATGTGSAGIGIVRLSGPSAIEIADRLFRGKRRLADLKSYTAAYGQLFRVAPMGEAKDVDHVSMGEVSDVDHVQMNEVKNAHDTSVGDVRDSSKEEVLDEVIALVMRAPHTYTTEDVVELSCHGGPLVMHRVLEELVAAGARLAEPGEFTKRAYLGGRIDLSEAEAVMDVIAAENETALDASLRQLRGSLKAAVTDLREKLLYETAYIESALDDPENYSLDGYPEHMHEVLENVRREINRLLSSAKEGRLLREGIRTAIVGRPNAGKSSVLNLLLGEERAIVTDIAGTTRDTLEEKALVGGVQLVLVDTAGIRETDDRVEQIGVQRARETLDQADLILLVIDAAEPLTEEDRTLLHSLAGGGESAQDQRAITTPMIILLNKNDLDTVVTRESIREILSRESSGESLPEAKDTETKTVSSEALKDCQGDVTQAAQSRPVQILEISAATGDGKKLLADEVRRLFFAGSLSDSREKYLLRARHTEALRDADAALQRVEESVAAHVGEDFYTIDLLAAYEALGRITGETLEDDLADKIFAEFCMGK